MWSAGYMGCSICGFLNGMWAVVWYVFCCMVCGLFICMWAVECYVGCLNGMWAVV